MLNGIGSSVFGLSLPSWGKPCRLPEKNSADVERTRSQTARVRLEREDRCRGMGRARDRGLSARASSLGTVRLSFAPTSGILLDQASPLRHPQRDNFQSLGSRDLSYAEIAARSLQLEAASELECDLEAQRYTPHFAPASEYQEAQRQIKELQRLLGKKTQEAEILKEAVAIARAKKFLLRSP